LSKGRGANTAGIAERILDYLESHPAAADTREGIERWWLGAGGGLGGGEAVQDALDELVARGLVRRREVPGGKAVYSRPGPRDDDEVK
jgi:hypothetical protein